MLTCTTGCCESPATTSDTTNRTVPQTTEKASQTVTAEEKRRHRTIRIIVGFTIGYNVVEALVAIGAGSIASSTALIGFGLDSTIEVLSAAAVAWQFSRPDPKRWEKLTLRIIAIAFFALAAYVAVSSTLALAGATRTEHSTVGIVLTALSVVIMPVLSYLERSAARAIGSHSAAADSRQTLICTYLSAAVLLGLVLNSLWGWWWADSIAGLVIALVALREGWQAWNGDSCCITRVDTEENTAITTA